VEAAQQLHMRAPAMTKSGIKAPKEDIDLIHARLKAAKLYSEACQTKQGAR
jgi:hypothetical protein